jgi:hypothetical protein
VTDAGRCGEIRTALGVYVMGAIDPADRDMVDSHLAWCVGCREELAGLAALPGRLGRVPAADVTVLVVDDPAQASTDGKYPPEAALRSLLERVATRRRRLMWRRAAAAAAVVVMASGGAVAVSRAVEPPRLQPSASALPWAATVRGSDPRTGAAATVRYLTQPWGLQVQVQVSGIAPGTRCKLWVSGPGGRAVAGGWTVAAGHTSAWYPASASLAMSGVRGFVVATPSGKSLVSVPVS